MSTQDKMDEPEPAVAFSHMFFFGAADSDEEWCVDDPSNDNSSE